MHLLIIKFNLRFKNFKIQNKITHIHQQNNRTTFRKIKKKAQKVRFKINKNNL